MAAAGSAASSSLLRVSVTGDAGTGKSSVIKRIVSHRFDNVPTRNAEFMGTRSNGVHVSLLHMPSISGSLAGRRKGTGPSQVLLEMQDQLPHVSSEQILAEEPWYNVSDEKVEAAPEKSSLFGGGAKLFANAAMSASKAAKGSSSQLSADADEGDDEGRPGPHREDWARNRQDPVGMRKSAPQEPGPHPLMDHQFAGRAKETVKEVLPGSAGTSPLMTPHGTHGWIVVFNLGSRASFERAQLQINFLLDKVGFSPEGKVACPVAIVLVGNKYDRYSGKRMAVRHQEIWEFLAASTTPGAIAGQLRKQRADKPLQKMCEAIIMEHKAAETAAALASKKDKPGASGSAKGSVLLSEGGQPLGPGSIASGGPGADEKPMVTPEQQANDPNAPPKDASEAFTRKTGIGEREYATVVKLRDELADPGSKGRICSNTDLLTGTHAVLTSELAEDAEAASELYEQLQACPALGVKYVEISCKTNHQIHMLERVLLRTLRLLQAPDAPLGEASRSPAKGGDAARDADFLQNIGNFFTSLVPR